MSNDIKKTNPYFSIIVPIYKVEQYLPQCVDSILSQSFCNFELILVDDGSPDNCPDICDEYALKDSRIKVIHKINGGLSSARNAGISNAVGEYIIFIDSDDFWKSNELLTVIHNCTLQSSNSIVVFNYEKLFENGLSTIYYNNQNSIIGCTLNEIISHNLWTVSAWNKVVKRQYFIDNDLFFREGITNEDLDWVIRVGIVSETFSYIPIIGLSYRQRSGSITQSLSVKSIQCLVSNIEYSVTLLKKNECKECLYSVLAYQYSVLLYDVSTCHDLDIFVSDLVELSFLLKYSSDSKTKMIRVVFKMLGVRATLAMLRLYSGLNNKK